MKSHKDLQSELKRARFYEKWQANGEWCCKLILIGPPNENIDELARSGLAITPDRVKKLLDGSHLSIDDTTLESITLDLNRMRVTVPNVAAYPKWFVDKFSKASKAVSMLEDALPQLINVADRDPKRQGLMAQLLLSARAAREPLSPIDQKKSQTSF